MPQCKYPQGQRIRHHKGNVYVIATTPDVLPLRIEATGEFAYGYHLEGVTPTDELPVWVRSIAEIEDPEKFTPLEPTEKEARERFYEREG